MVKNFKKTKNSSIYKTISNDILELSIQKKGKTLYVNLYNLSFKSYLKKMYLLVVILLTVNLFNMYQMFFDFKYVICAIIVSCLVCMNYFMSLVKEENLVIIKDLGLQITTKYSIGCSTKFIPEEQVQKFFINEVIYRQKVIYVLTLLFQDYKLNQKLLPLFFNIKPRLSSLEVIYRNIKELGEDHDT